MDNIPATTTLEQDTKTNADRRISFLIEVTQTILALGITAVMAYMAIKNLANEDVSNSFFLIIGFYFGKQFTSGTIKVGNTILDISKNDTKTF